MGMYNDYLYHGPVPYGPSNEHTHYEVYNEEYEDCFLMEGVVYFVSQDHVCWYCAMEALEADELEKFEGAEVREPMFCDRCGEPL